MKKWIILQLVILAAFFALYVAMFSPWQSESDENSTMYSHQFWGTRIGLCFSHVEQNKVKADGSGAVIVVWMKEKSYQDMRANQIFSAK
jgi:hypothetical protein